MISNLRKVSDEKTIILILNSATAGMFLAATVLVALVVSIFNDNLKSLWLQIPLLFVGIALYQTISSAISLLWYWKKEGKK